MYRLSYRFAAISPYVYANGERLSDLASGGYFVYHAPPGPLELSTQVDPNRPPVTLDAKAGETYYVMGYFHQNNTLPPEQRYWFQLEPDDNENGANRIKTCRLVPENRGQ